MNDLGSVSALYHNPVTIQVIFYPNLVEYVTVTHTCFSVYPAIRQKRTASYPLVTFVEGLHRPLVIFVAECIYNLLLLCQIFSLGSSGLCQ